MSEREHELATHLARVRERIAQACLRAGREEDEVTLVVVTKFFPAADVRILAGLGVRDVGENRHQEALDKAGEVADERLRWHFVGNLQSNKASAVASYAAAVHSVDRAKLVQGLAKGAHEQGRELDCLVQVDLDPDGAAQGRGGARPERVAELAALVDGTDGLRLRGVMAVAPLGSEPSEAFARLAVVAADVRRTHPDATWVSAGMSADLESAIAHGATHVRVGSAVLGPRPPIK